MRSSSRCLLAVASVPVLACASSSRAGEASGVPPAQATVVQVPDSARAAIVLYAAVSANQVTFGAQPRISVQLRGGTLDSVHVLERRNLPDPVVPGATYRNVYVAVEILGHVNANCVSRLLGASSAPVSQPARADSSACAGITVRDSVGRRP